MNERDFALAATDTADGYWARVRANFLPHMFCWPPAPPREPRLDARAEERRAAELEEYERRCAINRFWVESHAPKYVPQEMDLRPRVGVRG
jgi:hypothetical protein